MAAITGSTGAPRREPETEEERLEEEWRRSEWARIKAITERDRARAQVDILIRTLGELVGGVTE